MFGNDNFDFSKLPNLIANLSVRGNVQMRLYTLKVYKTGVEDTINLFKETGVKKEIIDKVKSKLNRKNIEDIYSTPVKKTDKLDIEFET